MATPARKQYREKAYGPLGAYLTQLPTSTTEVTLSFREVEDILGRKLPDSARNHREWWANQEHGSRSYHWQDAGFKTGPVNMTRQAVRFMRDASRAPRALSLQEVVSELNEAARHRPIGGLQEWRKRQHGLTRSATSRVFYSDVAAGRDYAFHVGGLSELQFNVGFETVARDRYFRHGVAFSLQPTREMPDIEPLKPKIERFNEYLRVYPDAFEGFSMWHWHSGRSSIYAVSPIPDERIVGDTFIFIGVQQPEDRIRIDWILDDFDRLLPLYEYVEGSAAFPAQMRQPAKKGFHWSPGNKARAARTKYERSASTVDKSLRHNILQDALYNHLEEIHGEGNTSGEQDCGNRTPVDVAVREGGTYTYYEIKTGLSAQSCIREALGQLLEYSYWPGAQEASRLVIVGEPPCDKNSAAFIKKLRKDFALPIEYQQFDLKSQRLIPRKP